MSTSKATSTLAMTAAALFLAGCGKEPTPTTTPDDAAGDASVADADATKKVRCYGVNECSGQTACDVTGKWDCAGNNDCKGKGWLKITKAECDEKGGSEDEAVVLGDDPAAGEAPADDGEAEG